MKSIFVFATTAILALTGLQAEEPTVLFKAGDAGYGVYRFPGLVRTSSGTLIASAEGRKSAELRWSETRPFIRVSKDAGKSWTDAKQVADVPADAKPHPIFAEREVVGSKVAAEGALGAHNLTGIADKDGGVHWLYTVEHTRVFYMKSDDNGENFSDPVEITATFDGFKEEVDIKALAVGPAHGIQLKSGRLVAPVWVSNGEEGIGLQFAASATIYSDDAGKTWKRGDIIVADNHLDKVKTGTKIEMPSETAIAELPDGTVIANIRNVDIKAQRAQATSKDGATGWSEATFLSGVLEPICYGSLVSTDAGLVFANPANMILRKSLTARLSTDGGATYGAKLTIEEGLAGYSDLASDGNTVHALYEQGALPTEYYAPEAIVFKTISATDIK